MLRRTFVILSAACLYALPASANDEVAAWSALRDGGVAIIRHTRAPGGGDPANFTLGDCTTQRNLSAEGRDQARRMGDMIRARGVGVGQVLHSRWCRARDTAELAFPGQTKPEPALDSFFQDRANGPDQTAATREIVENWSGPGALFLVAHQVNVTALTDIFPREGEIVVMRPSEQGGFTVVGSIPATY